MSCHFIEFHGLRHRFIHSLVHVISFEFIKWYLQFTEFGFGSICFHTILIGSISRHLMSVHVIHVLIQCIRYACHLTFISLHFISWCFIKFYGNSINFMLCSCDSTECHVRHEFMSFHVASLNVIICLFQLIPWHKM